MIHIHLNDLKLTPGQKKILILTGVISFAFLVFIRFIYLPQRGRFLVLKKELETTEVEIGRIKRTVGIEGDESMAKSLDVLQEKLRRLNERLPAKEENLLRELPNYAARFGIEIKSMQPQKKRIVAQVNGVAIPMRKGSVIQELQVYIVATGTYKNVGEYIRVLKSEFPSPIKVNTLGMSKAAAQEGGVLNVDLSLTAYLLSAPREGA